MTAQYYLSAEAQSALHLSAGRALGLTSQTLGYIPGTALRGALAAGYLAAHGDTPAFQRLINECRFGGLYPISGGATESAPGPRSSVTCSRAPGFLADGGHGVSDRLLAAEAALLAREAGGDGAPPPPLQCPRCAAELRHLPASEIVPWAGICQWVADEPRLASPQLGVAVQRPTANGGAAIGPNAAVYQTLAAGQRFAGRVAIPDEGLVDDIEHLLMAQDHQIWVGAGRSRGLGALRLDRPQPREETSDLAARQEQLMTALGAACGPQGAAAIAGQSYVSLTLRSPALLVDDFGRWLVKPDGDTLAGLCGLPAGSLDLRQAFVGTSAIEGWNAALGVPKPDAIAIADGSCWLARLRDMELPEALAALSAVEQQGLGERRQEGFGALRLCDALHWRVQQLEGDRQS